MIVFDAVCGNQVINSLADSDSLLTQSATISSTLYRQIRIHQAPLQVLAKCAPGFFKINILTKPL